MQVSSYESKKNLIRENLRTVKKDCPTVTDSQLESLKQLSRNLQLSFRAGDLLMIRGGWYVTHSGLLRIAQRRRCASIVTELSETVSSPREKRWVFKAIVITSQRKIFVGYGDADPSNISLFVQGAEMRVAETRAVNRALRKAYGIGLCSVEEIGPGADSHDQTQEAARIPPHSSNEDGNGNVRDRLCRIIRQHELNPNLVKAYATDFCGVKALRDASRDQVEQFVSRLADWAEKDRNALLCQLNSYLAQKEGAA